MGIGLKSLTLVTATLIFVLFSFLPTWQLGGNFPSQLAVAAPAPSAQIGTIPGEFAVNGNGYYPTAVRYTGNSGVTPQRLVKFEYENRNDNITAYVGGSEFEWQMGTAESGFNEGVNFDSRQGSDNLALLPMDVNGDRLSDLVQSWNNGGRMSIITYLSNGNGFNEGVNFDSRQGSDNLALLPMDVNGDRLSDLVQPWNNGGRMSIITYLSNGNGFNEGVNFDSR